MLFTRQDVMDFIQQEDVSFVRLAFCDVFGEQKNVSVMASELERAFEYGVSLDASAVAGFGDEQKSDLFLFPDSSTLAVLPWRPTHGRVIRLYCDIKYPDGTPFELDCRNILRNAVKAAAAEGINCNIGTEYEFYLFKTDENGEPTRIPHDNGKYMDIAPSDKGVNVRREICLALAEMGIIPENSHHESGPGQHEIDFKYSGAFTAADDATTFKSVVGSMADQNGLYASFSPKPVEGESGNGLHINISPSCTDGSDIYECFMAGILEHIKEITVFLNPVEESYKRFGSHRAPKYVTWSNENRSQLIRIPASRGDDRRIELRSPDPTADPYIACALLIYAGLDGVKRGLVPPAPMDINLYKASPEQLASLEQLPQSLSEAARLASESEFVKRALPSRLTDIYTGKV
ncbi:MAG: glutamine synthetase [Clostridiales bacterium]|nr:glutamine synthetase [Clostridiales bacterium]